MLCMVWSLLSYAASSPTCLSSATQALYSPWRSTLPSPTIGLSHMLFILPAVPSFLLTPPITCSTTLLPLDLTSGITSGGSLPGPQCLGQILLWHACTKPCFFPSTTSSNTQNLIESVVFSMASQVLSYILNQIFKLGFLCFSPNPSIPK